MLPLILTLTDTCHSILQIGLGNGVSRSRHHQQRWAHLCLCRLHFGGDSASLKKMATESLLVLARGKFCDKQ